jgi:hypothetical protein
MVHIEKVNATAYDVYPHCPPVNPEEITCQPANMFGGQEAGLAAGVCIYIARVPVPCGASVVTGVFELLGAESQVNCGCITDMPFTLTFS